MALCPVPIDALGQLKCEGGAGGLASQTQRAPHGGPGIDWKGGGASILPCSNTHGSFSPIPCLLLGHRSRILEILCDFFFSPPTDLPFFCFVFVLFLFQDVVSQFCGNRFLTDNLGNLLIGILSRVNRQP